MKKRIQVRVDRIIPEVPPKGERLKLIIDTDVGNEIDDFYALALAFASPDRFDIRAICGANYNNSRPGAGPESVATSVALARELLDAAGMKGKIPVLHGSQPLPYYGFPGAASEGSDFILDQARKASPEDPLWIVVLGAASTTASALLQDPDIVDNVRVVFHSRSDFTWPVRSVQFNVKGDIHAARSLLAGRAPLIWFDTGTHLMIPYAMTRDHLAPINRLGKFLHDFRDRCDWFRADDKGFFDMGDFVFLIDPGVCKIETVNVPRMDEYMYFDTARPNGKMLRVFDIDNNASWNMLFSRLAAMKI